MGVFKQLQIMADAYIESSMAYDKAKTELKTFLSDNQGLMSVMPVLYRGCGFGKQHEPSWTTCRYTAAEFSRRHGNDGVVYILKDVLACPIDHSEGNTCEDEYFVLDTSKAELYHEDNCWGDYL